MILSLDFSPNFVVQKSMSYNVKIGLLTIGAQFTKKIMPGEQIYNSYNRCNACSSKEDMKTCDTYSFYRTPDLFTHFGFVEDYPQSWAFDPAPDSSDSSDDETEFEFCMKRDPESGEVDAYWDDDELPNDDDAEWLKVQIKRLEKLSEEKDELEKKLVQVNGEEEDEDKMTRWEWESTWRYHESLLNALKTALQAAESGFDDEEDGEGEGEGDINDEL